MIPTTAYILISTLISGGDVTQTTATFSDKPSCGGSMTKTWGDVIDGLKDNLLGIVLTIGYWLGIYWLFKVLFKG